MFQRDLTKGPVFRTMGLFALPMILGNLLQQGYNIVDTWVVGRFVGPGALAAVGSAFALMTFLTSVLLGLCMGSGTVFSLCFGRGDRQRLEESICGALALTGAVAAVLTAGSLLLVGPILRWMNIPPEITHMTGEYLTLVFWGIPAIAVYNFFGAYLKALGDSVVPLVFLGISTALNIGLDILLVAVWGQGAAGAAAATVIAQYVSAVGMAAYALVKDKPLRRALSKSTVKKAALEEIVRYSFLTCLQQSVMNLGILMVQGLVNSFGTTVMAAFAAGVKIDAFAYMPAQEFGNAFSTFIAQNAGAKERGRIKQGIRCGVAATVGYCLAVSLALWFLARPLMLIFVDPAETAILAQGVGYLHIIGPFYCGIGCLFLLYGLYRALGRPAISVVLTVISLGTRVGLSYALSAVPAIGVAGIWCSIPIGWALADLTGLLLYRARRDQLLP